MKYEQLSATEKFILQIATLCGGEPYEIENIVHRFGNFNGETLTSREISEIVHNRLRYFYRSYQFNRVDYWSDVINDLLQQPYFEHLLQVTYEQINENFTRFSLGGPELLEIAILKKDENLYISTAQKIQQSMPNFLTQSQITLTSCRNLPMAWQQKLPTKILCYYLHDVLSKYIVELKALPDDLQQMVQQNLYSCSESHVVRKQWANMCFLQGKISQALEISQCDFADGLPYASMLRGMDRFLRKDADAAWKIFDKGIKQYHRISKKDCFEDFYAFFALLCLLFSNEKNRQGRLQKLSQQAEVWDTEYTSFFVILSAIEDAMDNDFSNAQRLCEEFVQPQQQPILRFFAMIVTQWIKKSAPVECHHMQIIAFHEYAMQNSYTWVAANLFFVLYGDAREQIYGDCGQYLLVDAVQLEERWKRSLQMITEYLQGETQKDTRIAWFIEIKKNRNWRIEAREQTLRANGTWNKGRKAKFTSTSDVPTQQDREIYEEERRASYAYSRSAQWKPVVAKMVGHPYVFWGKEPHTQVEVVAETPHIVLEKTSTNYKFLFPYNLAQDNIICLCEENKIRVITLSERQGEILRMMGQQLILPNTAKEQIQNVTKLIAKEMDILSPNTDMGNIEFVEVPTKVYARFDKILNKDFRADLIVKPFGEEQVFPPGEGTQTFFDAATKRYLSRNVKSEKHDAQKIVESVSLPADNYSWELDTAECLQLLLKWKDTIPIEWIHGKKPNISSLGSVSLKVVQKKDWFELDSQIHIDDKRVWDIKKFLKFLDNNNYIQLSDDHFAIVTNELRQKLEELSLCMDKKRIHKALAPHVGNILSGFDEVEYNIEWQKHVQKINKIRSQQVNIPQDFNATLRPYQKQGFIWLSQLLEWGVGACLADDMGLGKTIQTLALLLKNKNKGASLVVAPTSVCINWAIECNKFTPSLTPYVFNSQSPNALLKRLKNGDLLITSYGILQNRADVFSKKKWNIVILDEAQSIKNIYAKRTQAALKLQSKFRMITTGTPVENSLHELWTLFHFINPGLLGSLQTFKNKFIVPIELHKCENATQRLKNMVAPFILRRTKNQVLKDLPEKIEKVMYIDMSHEENNFYEALRQKSIERFTKSKSQREEGQKHIEILAEIMRLRRACCHPQLVHPNSQIVSSKLQVFGEILDEIMQGKDKVLVFSQFVDYLKMAEKIVKDKNILYQYLDGSTTQKQRQKRIDLFQNGESQVFLISLKAGGVGLNLTEANFVIHLDPWWNPAAEDQATDRAHRIGQKKVVTVYRLVTNHTIEQKIIGLHENKRDLASKILDGTNKPSKLDAKMLLQLLTE
ncbi:DEAD/DEAH box helicase [Candidatus Uabimicrobium amorphum]|uniref:SWF/SNF family helicase n=1 Tax=Uabimicrobium amorphum TaxID=2596890 RepID=A0A5S9IP56_UABAM|nr:DEAD/DEAH box helicase [Candidatus Uabimicrobium amorphum]BBM85489.1 SWF/SNF family helicase [Candidatus Uabimicrobium amorphum]